MPKIKLEPLKDAPDQAVNGKPADLEHMDLEAELEVKRAFTDELKSQKRIFYVKKKHRYTPETRRVATRVRHLDPREIRKEKGLMAMPFKKTGENVLYMILNQGPISTGEMAKELGVKITGISGMISDFYMILGTGTGPYRYIKREPKPNKQKGYLYSATQAGAQVSPESAYQKYLAFKRDRHAAKVKSKKQQGFEAVRSDVKNIYKDYNQRQETVSALIGNLMKDKLNVDVNVKIEVLFGFKKD